MFLITTPPEIILENIMARNNLFDLNTGNIVLENTGTSKLDDINLFYKLKKKIQL
jgi:hypothetical protein